MHIISNSWTHPLNYFISSSAMTMAIPVAKRVRDVFYKHRASGMIGHTAVWVGMVVAELPYLLLISVIYVVIYCATVRSPKQDKKLSIVCVIFILPTVLSPILTFHHDRLVSSLLQEISFGLSSSSSYTHHRSLTLHNVSCVLSETKRQLVLSRAFGLGLISSTLVSWFCRKTFSASFRWVSGSMRPATPWKVSFSHSSKLFQLLCKRPQRAHFGFILVVQVMLVMKKHAVGPWFSIVHSSLGANSVHQTAG